MTTLLERSDPVDLMAGPRRAVLTVAVGAGVTLGVVDLLLQATLPYPWANLANSSAVWALAAFGYGAWVRVPGVRVAVGGSVLLVVAVVSYYLAAALALGDDVANVWATSSLLWAAAGVLAGVVFGVAGSWCRAAGWRGVLAAASAGAVCFAEYGLLLRRVDEMVDPSAAVGFRTDLLSTALITAVLGLVVLLVAARTPAVIGRAMLVAVPLTAIGFAGFVGFSAVGFVV